MTTDPASWQPGTLIVNRDDMLVAHVDERGAGGWHVFVADMEIAVPEFMSDAELAAEWQPLADVVARGWEQRQEVGIDYCLVHDGVRDQDESRCDFAQDDDQCDEDGEPRACRLMPLSYPITEGNEP